MAGHIGVVVGLDKTGKTSLLQLIQSLDPPGIEVRKLVPDPRQLPPGRTLELLHQEIDSWRLNPVEHTLLYDRLPVPDEFVYGDLPENRLFYWDHDMLLHRVRFVYVYPDDLQDYLRAREIEPDDKYTHYAELLSRYEIWLRATRCPVLKIPHFEEEALWFDRSAALKALEFVRS